MLDLDLAGRYALERVPQRAFMAAICRISPRAHHVVKREQRKRNFAVGQSQIRRPEQQQLIISAIFAFLI